MTPGDWPEADETAMRRLAAEWGVAADGIKAVGGNGDRAMSLASDSISGITRETMKEHWSTLGGSFGEAERLCRDLSTSLDGVATEVEQTKQAVIDALGDLDDELTTLRAGEGASATEIAEAELATQNKIRVHMDSLQTKISGHALTEESVNAAVGSTIRASQNPSDSGDSGEPAAASAAEPEVNGKAKSDLETGVVHPLSVSGDAPAAVADGVRAGVPEPAGGVAVGGEVDGGSVPEEPKTDRAAIAESAVRAEGSSVPDVSVSEPNYAVSSGVEGSPNDAAGSDYPPTTVAASAESPAPQQPTAQAPPVSPSAGGINPNVVTPSPVVATAPQMPAPQMSMSTQMPTSMPVTPTPTPTPTPMPIQMPVSSVTPSPTQGPTQGPPIASAPPATPSPPPATALPPAASPSAQGGSSAAAVAAGFTAGAAAAAASSGPTRKLVGKLLDRLTRPDNAERARADASNRAGERSGDVPGRRTRRRDRRRRRRERAEASARRNT